MLNSTVHTTSSIPLRRLFVLGIVFLFQLDLVSAQVSTVRPSTSQELTARIDTLKSADSAKVPDLEAEAEAEAAIVTWTEALTAAKEREAFTAQRTDYEAQAAAAPKELAGVEAALKKENVQPTDGKTKPEDAPLEKAENEQANTAAALKAAQKSVEDLTAKQAERRRRSNEIPDQLAAITVERDNLPAAAQPPATAPELQKAQFELNLQRQLALSEQLLKLGAETNFYNASSELLTKRLDLANRQVERFTQADDFWRKQVTRARGKAADDDAKRAKEQEAKFQSIESLAAYAADTT